MQTCMENKLEYKVGKKKTPTFTAQEIRVLKRNNHKKEMIQLNYNKKKIPHSTNTTPL